MRRHVDIVIVGSGFAGLGMGMSLKKTGRHDFVILEKAADLGGTWRDNTYPGCACDVPSPLYSFSFAPNPRWSRLFSPQREIYQYLQDCARRAGLQAHLRFDSPVTAATYDEGSGTWLVDVDGEEAFSCRVIVSAVGALHLPKMPAMEGLDSFRGTTFHSAGWRHDTEIAGKRVAVVGTGASAIQLVPEIADSVAQLDVYQRTPAWLMPKPDRAIARGEQRLFERHPIAQRILRDLLYGVLELRGMGFTVAPRMLPAVAAISRRHLERQVPDPALRAKLTPDYQIGCKRVLISSNFYPALQRPNVELVTEPIKALTPGGVQTTDGVERATDVVVFATGFDLQANLQQMVITGKDARTLEAAWADDGVSAHLGIMVSGFPNLFLLLGPNTGLAHNSVVFMIESQIAFVTRALRMLDRSGARQLDVRADVQRRSVRAVQDRLVGSVWQSGCHSWYLDEAGRNYAIWPRTTMRYWLDVRRPKRRDYELGRAPEVDDERGRLQPAGEGVAR